METNNLSLLRGGWPILRRCTERMSYFVGDMLAFSKPRVPNLTPCSIDNVLTDAEATFRSMMAQKDVSIEVDSSLVNGLVQVDPDALFRGLLNILLNAGEAVAAETGAIRVVAETLEDGALRIDVSDNGPGIPEGLEEKVFAPFFSTKGSKGTGPRPGGGRQDRPRNMGAESPPPRLPRAGRCSVLRCLREAPPEEACRR